MRPIKVFYSLNSNKENVVSIGYSAEALNKDVKLSWEHTEFKWVSKDEALNHELPDIHRAIVESF